MPQKNKYGKIYEKEDLIIDITLRCDGFRSFGAKDL